jgi:branched-subunit amino acid ABC-type transport system permease component
MGVFLPFLLAGIAVGAIYAITALGFVLVFKATSVLNFGHGAFLMLASYLGDHGARVAWDMPFWLGLIVIALALAVTRGHAPLLDHEVHGRQGVLLGGACDRRLRDHHSGACC